MVFPSPTLAVVVNGVDTVNIFDTGDRSANGKWKNVHALPMETVSTAIQLLDAVFRVEGENMHVDCLVASVEDVEGETKEKHRSPYITVIEWLTLASADGKTWREERTRRLEGACPVQCAYLDRKAASVHIVAPKVYTLIKDSVKPVDNADEWDVIGDEVFPSKMYTWSQTERDAFIQLTIPEGVTKADLNVTMGGRYIEVGVKNGVELINSGLYNAVEPPDSEWTLEGRRFEICLEKIDDAIWPLLLWDDNRAEFVMTREQIEAFHQRRGHLTTEHWIENPAEEYEKPYNSQVLEDCDAGEGNGNLIMRIDGETHRISHKVINSHSFVFSVQLSPDSTPTLCLRHDVDAFLWQADGSVDPNSSPWKHLGALNAFGYYVLASEQQQRFVTCSPDMSVAVIAHANRHVYLYRRRSAVLGHFAKQQVISLDCSPDEILGIRATNTKLFVTSEKQVFMYVMNDGE